jgi:isopentenyldiphosphate isomerase
LRFKKIIILEEYIDIVTKEGKPTGRSAPKSEIHSKGLYHHTVHLWLYTKVGEILLAQRSASKVICPLLWDVSVAGHIDAGESMIEAAKREAQEEIGLTIHEKDLENIGVFECFQKYDNGIVDNEFHNTFISELKVDISLLKLQKEEVEAVKLVSLEGFKKILKHIGNDNHFVASNKSYYELVVHAIEQKLITST